MNLKIETVFVKVRDINKSKKWYENKLNLKVRWENLDKKVVAFNCGETDLTLVQEKKPLIYDDSAFNIYVDDFENIHKNLCNEGITVSSIKTWNNIRYFEFQDLDGNYLEIINYD